jgi:sulfate adenylyltransferase subunit 1
MVTAASTADLAIILVDARRGVLTQTRRHSAIAHLLGIPRLVVAVNKMDLVGYDRDVFERIRTEYRAFAASLGIRDARFLPLSALNGDMVVERGTRLDWYAGPTLMEVLEGAPAAEAGEIGAFRFPVQLVCRPQASADPELHDFRGFMGRVESGGIAVGERVRAQPSGLESRVREIRIGKRRLERAHRGQSVTLLLEDEIDISRGDMLARPGESPAELRGLEAMLCWLSARPLDRQRRYLVRHTTREVRASVAGIDYRLDVDAMERRAATRLDANDIGRVSLRLAGPLFADRYAANRATGAFVLIDESTNDTAAAGMIL